MEIEHWDTEWGEMSEQSLRSRLQSEGYTVSKYAYPPGTYFPEHQHSMEKKDAVVSGRFMLRANGREFLLGTGGSRSLQLGGSAIHMATNEVLDRARALAAQLLEASVEDVVVHHGRGLGVAGAPTSAISWGQLAKAAGSPELRPPTCPRARTRGR